MPPLNASETASRYGNASATKFAGGSGLSAADVPTARAELQAAFDTEKTYSATWRLAQLAQFKRMMIEGTDKLSDALLKDLHKSPFEGFATELGLVIDECNTAMSHLHEWMKPEATDNSAMNIPCWSTTQRDPLGVCLVMGAWNYPVQLTLAPVVGAIAGGNCVMIKPGSYAPHTSHAISELVAEYMDPECFKVAEGDRTVTTALLKERWETIFFTGSGFVGKVVAAAAAKHLTPCVLELGGKSPAIVDKSADLEHAAERLVWGTFLNGGQTCVRPDFLLVHEEVGDKFLEQLQKTILKFYGSDPQQTEWFGRCINHKAFDRLEAIIKASAANVKIGGRTDRNDKYIEPTVLDYGSDWDAFLASPAMQDEIFGPILPTVRFTDVEQVVSLVKGLPTGKPLALYAYATDQRFINVIKKRTTSGGLCINDSLMHLVNHDLPFGGVGASGMGSYHGKRSFNAFTHEKAVLEKSPMLDQSFVLKPLLAARFPPYTPMKQTLIKLFSLPFAGKAVNLPLPWKSRVVWFFAVVYFLYSQGFRITRV